MMTGITLLLLVIHYRYHCLDCPLVHAGTTHTAPGDESPDWRLLTGDLVACMITICSCSACMYACMPAVSVQFAIYAVTVTKLCLVVTACGQPQLDVDQCYYRAQVIINTGIAVYFSIAEWLACIYLPETLGMFTPIILIFYEQPTSS